MAKPNKKFDLDLEYGKLGEDIAKALLLSEKCRVEVKRDRKLSETGYIAIEFRYNGEPSGLSTTQASWWAFVMSGERWNDEVVVFIRTERLREILRRYPQKITTGGDGDKVQMFLVMPDFLLKGLQ